jgi:hypothetical protein
MHPGKFRLRIAIAICARRPESVLPGQSRRSIGASSEFSLLQASWNCEPEGDQSDSRSLINNTTGRTLAPENGAPG